MRLHKMQILYSIKTYSHTAGTERISIYHLWYNQSWRCLYLQRDGRNGLWSKATQSEVWMEMERRKNRETNNPTGEPGFHCKQSQKTQKYLWKRHHCLPLQALTQSTNSQLSPTPMTILMGCTWVLVGLPHIPCFLSYQRRLIGFLWGLYQILTPRVK